MKKDLQEIFLEKSCSGSWWCIIFVYMLFPFYWVIDSALKTENQLTMTPATFIPRDPDNKDVSPTLQNFRSVFQNGAFLLGD